MTPEQLNKFKETIEAVADNFIMEGGNIIAGRFTEDEDQCPISCLGVDLNQPLSDSISAIMGFPVTGEEVWGFVNGFDNNLSRYNQQTYQIGQQLRAKYITE